MGTPPDAGKEIRLVLLVRIAGGSILGLALGLGLGIMAQKGTPAAAGLNSVLYAGLMLGLLMGLAAGVAAGLAGSAGVMAGSLGRSWGEILGRDNKLSGSLPLSDLRERITSLYGQGGGSRPLGGAVQRWVLVKILRSLLGALENLRPGETTGAEFERILRSGAERAMWKALKRPLAAAGAVILLGGAVVLTGCGGSKPRPDWVKPGLIGVEWPILEGEISGLIGWQARQVATAVRSHILIEAPKLFGMDAEPFVEGKAYAYVLKPRAWKWAAVKPEEDKSTPHSSIPEHEYGLDLSLLNADGKMVWHKSRSKTVPSKRGKVYIPVELGVGTAVRKILMTCPLAWGVEEKEALNREDAEKSRDLVQPSPIPTAP